MVWLALTLAILNGLVIGYYWLLPLLGSRRRSAAMPAVDPPVHRFALVVPAHNEEATIRGTLESHARLDYPAELFMVFVIADNCTDRTAKVARSRGRCVPGAARRRAPGKRPRPGLGVRADLAVGV